MKKQLLKVLSMTFIICGQQAFAFNTNLLKSDKELISNFMNQSMAYKGMQRFKESTHRELSAFRSTYSSIMSNSLDTVMKGNTCDLELIKQMRMGLQRAGLASSKTPFEEYLHLARQQNMIDDVLAKFLSKHNALDNKIRYYIQNPSRPRWNSKVRYRVSDKKAVIEAYKKFEKGATEGTSACLKDAFSKLASVVSTEFKVKPGNFSYLYNILISTNLYALNNKLISEKTWNVLEVLRYSAVLNPQMRLSNYVDNILNAKNKLADELSYIRRADPNAVASNQTKRYLQLYVDRANGLTRREKLYEKYNSQQILLLADILVKTSKRMNADKSEIHITYVEDDNNNTPDEIYVISPMEQYRMSLKMLRKDYAGAMLSSLFGGKSIDYEDIVVAALEAGVITFDELDFIVQYEYFWNPPKESVWKQVLGFFFDFAGTASFYLPAPYNIVGAIGLVFTQTKLFKKDEIDSSGNVNSIF